MSTTTETARAVPTISLTFAREQLVPMAGGTVPEEMRAYFADAIAALDASPAEAIARGRRRKGRAA